ncbi:hypothetical protein EB796_017751 [Bugula neritina]|uniref:Uncharacterized protein n=1 Tax=Bugula neritina TaxID=10212 RepID=A0A7J7JCE6_BUGNE|nr:hypothetical protein EB796_017751 [Bugula neritina]
MHNPIVPKYIKKADRELTHHMALSSKSSTLDDTGKLWDFQYMNKTSTKLLMTNNQDAAINTVSLNPNRRSHGWLLCGGTHGLLHFIKVT